MPAIVPLQKWLSGRDLARRQEDNDVLPDRPVVLYGEGQMSQPLPAEGQVPPDWAYSAGVSYFAGDMKDYLKTLNDTMLDRSHKSAKVAEMTRQLTAKWSKPSDWRRSKPFVILSPNPFAKPGLRSLNYRLSELSAADTTLADGYGHAADRAILLHAMLTGGGLPAGVCAGVGLAAHCGHHQCLAVVSAA
jgi:hypothetical protein